MVFIDESLFPLWIWYVAHLVEIVREFHGNHDRQWSIISHFHNMEPAGPSDNLKGSFEPSSITICKLQRHISHSTFTLFTHSSSEQNRIMIWYDTMK